MTGPGLILVAILAPLLGAFLLPVAGKIAPYIRNLLTLVFILISFVASALALPPAIAGNPLQVYWLLPFGLTFGFLADSLAVFMALTVSMVTAIIVFYSFGYIYQESKRYEGNQNEYYLMVVLLIGSMMGLVYATNLVLIYLFWQMVAICCWRLVGFYRGQEIIRRANKAFLFTVGGALLMLAGFIGIYIETGSFHLPDMPGNLVISNWVMLLILGGIFSKSATLPLHSWLPDAAVAPSPVTALVHAAVLVKMGVYMFARLFLVNFQLAAFWQNAIPVIAAISLVVAAGAAIVENDIKRILAYSTISQLAFILLGLASGLAIGTAGALLYILLHAIAAAGLFLCAGIVEHSTHTKDIRQMGGLFRRLPATMVCFLCCAFLVMGLPPFGGFFAKYMLVSGALEMGRPWLAIIFIGGAFLTIVYLARLILKVFFGELSHPDIREGTWEMISSVTVLASLSLLFGVLVNLPLQLVTSIVESLGRW